MSVCQHVLTSLELATLVTPRKSIRRGQVGSSNLGKNSEVCLTSPAEIDMFKSNRHQSEFMLGAGQQRHSSCKWPGLDLKWPQKHE